ncbi:unnamed protein product [Brassicogethes aeneus]|uniref:Nose resistant-to-fluoxetine protein N-terminal domain-containing protein n=1 Tax=Brassicogethes aeneus TaxID=1431903 RepID=A0A9P0BBQ6_BRAAE|nr:unnamed protein product [Brassicogethes aeneus]
MAKRTATTELNHDNWEREDEPEEAGTFQRATEDTLKKRVIKSARRRNPASTLMNSGDAANKGAFASFQGFGKAATPAAPNFNFLSNLSNPPKTNGTTTPDKKDGTAPKLIFGNTNTNNTIEKKTEKSQDYWARLKGLNESVSKWIDKWVKEDPLCNLQPVFDDYKKYFDELEQDRPKESTESKSVENKNGSKLTESASATFSFGSAAATVASSVSLAAATTTTSTTGLSFGNTSKPMFSFGSANNAPTTTGSGTENVSFASTVSANSFSFGSGTFSAPVETKKSNTEENKNGGEDDEDEPPKVEYNPVMENDHVYTVKCKLFVKKDGKFGGGSVGNLFLKNVKDSEKVQLIVRADTNLGNVLCNLILSESIPTQRLGNKDVMLVCLPLPDSKPPPTPILLRVKSADEADKLLEFAKEMCGKVVVCVFLCLIFLNNVFGNIIIDQIKQKAEYIIDSAAGKNECTYHLKLLIKDIIFRKPWALEMLDASAKIQPGLLAGNLYQFGNFDQCLAVYEKTNKTVIQGQYCTVLVVPSSKFKGELSFLFEPQMIADFKKITLSTHALDILRVLKMIYGICIPKSCNISTLQDIWDYIEHMFGMTFHMDFYDFTCRYTGKPLDPLYYDKYVYMFFGAVALLVLMSTLYDVLIHQKGKVEKIDENTKEITIKEPKDNYKMCFSVYSNWKKLFLNKGFEDSSSMTCIYGMKVLSMFWIIHGHRFASTVFAGSVNGFDLYEWRTKFYNLYIMGASFSVDTFLTLSGMLLISSFLKFQLYNPQIKFSFKGFYFYRFLRLGPGLLATILFYISVLKLLSDGPIWPIVMKKITFSCQNTWWATLFFATNFVDMNYQCVEQSWYLAVDSQLYFISPIILLNISKYPKKVFAGMLVTLIASSAYAYYITITYNLGAVYMNGNKDYHQYIYQPTHIRIAAWLIGLAFGYLIFYYKSFKLSKKLQVLSWSICIGTVAFIQYIHIFFTYEYDPYISALFNAFTRPMWAFAISSMVYLCISGNGGVINEFLSCHFFKIISRLTYSMYLTHLGVLAYMIAPRRHSEHFSTFKCWHDFFGDMVLILSVSLVMCLTFEYPMIRIGGLMFRAAPKAQTVGTNTTPNEKVQYVVSVIPLESLKKKKKLKST